MLGAILCRMFLGEEELKPFLTVPKVLFGDLNEKG